MMADPDRINWLLEGDPAIRWQVTRDLIDASESEIEEERRRVATMGWGKQLLDLQSADGRWAADEGPKGYEGVYSPKWTSTTYTLLLLRRLGLEPENVDARDGCRALVDHSEWTEAGAIRPWKSDTTDTCVCAIISSILEWFQFNAPVRRDGLLDYLLSAQRTNGSWLCDVGPMHATLLSLEALQLRRQNSPDTAIDEAMREAHDFLLRRNLFRSPDTDEVLDPAFTRFSFPPRWHYDVLGALDHFQEADAPTDSRAAEAIDLVREKRRDDGRWPLQNRHPGKVHFEMEAPSEPSRWNTLRALRVLRWWEQRDDQ